MFDISFFCENTCAQFHGSRTYIVAVFQRVLLGPLNRAPCPVENGGFAFVPNLLFFPAHSHAPRPSPEFDSQPRPIYI